LVLTGLGGGVLGAAVTTYGSQTRERREARAQARETIRQVRTLVNTNASRSEITHALDDFENQRHDRRPPQGSGKVG
jgi:hypothetical protein